MNYFKPSKYSIENAIMEIARYTGGIFVGDEYTMKDHGDYVEINIDADNEKGHVSYDLYFDEDGRLIRWEPHKQKSENIFWEPH